MKIIRPALIFAITFGLIFLLWPTRTTLFGLDCGSSDAQRPDCPTRGTATDFWGGYRFVFKSYDDLGGDFSTNWAYVTALSVALVSVSAIELGIKNKFKLH